MRMYDLIEKKRDGVSLTADEIAYMIKEYVGGTIPDYQMAAMLMAIFFQGMADKELAALTVEMAKSGDMADLSSIPGVKVDKHSTGGVGDKTTLIACPIAAACGVKIAKMSGRGLGHTGGTVDKLESIPGYRTTLDRQTFLEAVRKNGISLIGQSENLAPADKKLYALRDVTATVESIPLVAASIMSKKLAAGSDCIVLDVKTGSGAFFRKKEKAAELAEKLVAIGEHNGKRTVAFITNMDVPLGACIGNALEVKEAVETLQGKGPEDLTKLCVKLAATMIEIAGLADTQKSKAMACAAIEDGSAFRTFLNMTVLQGGDPEVLLHTERLFHPEWQREVKAEKDGWIRHIDTHACGIAAGMLGAGRQKKDDGIDYQAGIRLLKKTGDPVKAGEILAVLYSSRRETLEAAGEHFLGGIEIGETKAECIPMILASVDKDGIVWQNSETK